MSGHQLILLFSAVLLIGFASHREYQIKVYESIPMEIRDRLAADGYVKLPDVVELWEAKGDSIVDEIAAEQDMYIEQTKTSERYAER